MVGVALNPRTDPRKPLKQALVVGKPAISAMVAAVIAEATTACGLLFEEGACADRIVLHRKEEAEKVPPMSARPK